MSLDDTKSILGMDSFSKLEVIVIIVNIVMILAVFLLLVLKTRVDHQKCQDYAELINVEYVYKQRLGCFIKNKQNEWQFINLEKLGEANR